MAGRRYGQLEIVLDGAPHIRRNGKDLAVRPQVIDVLTYIVARPGELVTHQQLAEHLWPDGQRPANPRHAVYDCMRQIRNVLADQFEALIKSHHGRGYEWIGDPQAPSEPAAATSSGAPKDVSSRRERRRLLWDLCERVVYLIREDQWVPDLVLATGYGGAILGGFVARNIRVASASVEHENGPLPMAFIDRRRGRRRRDGRIPVEVTIDDRVTFSYSSVRTLLVCHGYIETGETAVKLHHWLRSHFRKAVAGGGVRTASLYYWQRSPAGVRPDYCGEICDDPIPRGGEPWLMDGSVREV